MKKLKSVWQRYMLRPFLYTVYTRLALGLCAALLGDHFFSANAGRPLRGTLFLLAAALFALFAFIAWLRLDGVSMPKPLNTRLGPKKRKDRISGDMIDFVEEEPSTRFEDLDDEEKDACLLAANLACCAAMLIASLF